MQDHVKPSSLRRQINFLFSVWPDSRITTWRISPGNLHFFLLSPSPIHLQSLNSSISIIFNLFSLMDRCPQFWTPLRSLSQLGCRASCLRSLSTWERTPFVQSVWRYSSTHNLIKVSFLMKVDLITASCPSPFVFSYYQLSSTEALSLSILFLFLSLSFFFLSLFAYQATEGLVRGQEVKDTGAPIMVRPFDPLITQSEHVLNRNKNIKVNRKIFWSWTLLIFDTIKALEWDEEQK